MLALTDQQLQDFQEAVTWQVGERLPDGRVLGSPEKRGAWYEGEDPKVRLLADHVDLADKTVLELGPGEGHLTAQLAQRCRHVTSVEARPKNIVCGLIRLFVHDLSNVRVVLGDANDVDQSFGTFDVLFHVGLLYHLQNPVVHLHNLGGMADYLLLDTHYCADDDQLPRADIEFAGKVYKAFHWTEGAWHEPWAGVAGYARWLHRDTLLEVLREIGFDSLTGMETYQVGDLHRLTLLAERSARRQTGPAPAQAVATPSANGPAVLGEASAARLRLLESELASARKEITQLRSQVEAMRQSWTWTIGRAAIDSLRYVKTSIERLATPEPPASSPQGEGTPGGRQSPGGRAG